MKTGSIVAALLVYALCQLWICPILAQTYIDLQPGPDEGKDAYIHDINIYENLGNHEDFAGIAWTNSGTPCVARNLLKFDLSMIPSNAVILSAYLSLFHNPTTPNIGHSTISGSNQAVLQRIMSDWDEYSVTWNNQPNTTIQNQVIIPESISQDQDYSNIDVTTFVQEMIEKPLTNFGLLIRLKTEIHYRSLIFASSDHADPELRPLLEIIYIWEPPQVEFIFDTQELQVDFTGLITNEDNILWRFGDGTISNEKKPVHIYEDFGDYDVTLVASNVFGADSVTKTVSLCELPVAAFESEIDIRTIFLTNTSSVADSCYWDFGDGYSSTLKDPVYEYISEGEYLVTLISYNECGSDTTTTLISVPDNQLDDQAFILIYPNPTRGKVDIKIFAENFLETDMVLFNEIGQSIKKIKLTEISTSLDLSRLQAGVYVVKLTASNIYHHSVLIIF